MNPAFELEAESIIAFLFITIVYLSLITLVALSSKTNSLRLIGLGLLTAVVSVAYSGIIPFAAPAATLMMKIAFLLVFAGVLIPFYSTVDNSKTSSAVASNDGESDA